MTSLAAPRSSVAATVRLAVAGDEAAFARIVAAYHADLVRVAYGICGDRDLAQDAAQSAWLIAWRKLGTLHDPERLRPWLVAVAANEARHILRRRPSVTPIEFDPPGASRDDPSVGIRRVDLVNALHHLKPDERALIALRYGTELDSNEIAPILGISATGVRSRLARVIARLRKELDDA
jgi:RNA polymerase sigma-70 factor (ECF subfamily)